MSLKWKSAVLTGLILALVFQPVTALAGDALTVVGLEIQDGIGEEKPIESIAKEDLISKRTTGTYDTFNLRHNADFRVELGSGVYWVPANVLGKPQYTDTEIMKLALTRNPQLLQEKISTLYDVIQYFHISGFRSVNADHIDAEYNGISWEHHKTGEEAILTNYGDCSGFAALGNYLLQGDYDEVGFISFNTQHGGHVFNYIKQNGKYYFFDFTLLDFAREELGTFSNSRFTRFLPSGIGLGSLHEAESIEDFLAYYTRNWEEPIVFEMYQADRVIPIGCQRERDLITYYLPDNMDIKMVYDNGCGKIQIVFLPPPEQTPRWKVDNLPPLYPEDGPPGSLVVRPEIQYIENFGRESLNTDIYFYTLNETPMLLQEVRFELSDSSGSLLQTEVLDKDQLAQHMPNRLITSERSFRLGTWYRGAEIAYIRGIAEARDIYGNTVQKQFEIDYSVMKQHMKNSYRAPGRPSLYDTKTLRANADFKIAVAEGVYWRPVSCLGRPQHTANELLQYKGKPEELKARINTLYDLIQYLQAAQYSYCVDNTQCLSGNPSDYARAEVALMTNCGNNQDSHHLVSYLLEGNYDGFGILNLHQRENGVTISYIKHKGKYYLFHLGHYRNDWMNTAVEDGTSESYFDSDFISGNLHEVNDLRDYVKYCNERFNYPIRWFAAIENGETVLSGTVDVIAGVHTSKRQQSVPSEYDTQTLRHNADFRLPVGKGVYWVPANTLGKSNLTREDILDLGNDPKVLQREIDTLYEVIQYIQVADFRSASDNIRIPEGEINWEHHKPGELAITTNEGCCATISNLLNYLLKGDYEEVGFIAFSHSNGNGHVFNYIKHNGKYYIVDLTHYRNDFMNTAVEDGDYKSYYASDFIAGNIHEVEDLRDFAAFYRKHANRPPVLFSAYAAENVLPIDSVRRDNELLIVYPDTYQDKVTILFDDPNDTARYEFVDPPTKYPEEWEPYNTKHVR